MEQMPEHYGEGHQPEEEPEEEALNEVEGGPLEEEYPPETEPTDESPNDPQTMKPMLIDAVMVLINKSVNTEGPHAAVEAKHFAEAAQLLAIPAMQLEMATAQIRELREALARSGFAVGQGMMQPPPLQ